ncbi:DNA-binding transcriptional regulator, MocR family, contains an aminotransferase domain [Rhizobiales bacterium GAS191]|nr:DNA-binding transcriptional regulator, MocR family, contains an aminotransferase domain [Rhizobiales bacterium GAS191]
MAEIGSIDWESAFAGRAEGMRASEIRELLKLLDQPDIISFAGGIPDPALFPSEALRSAFATILADPQLGPKSLQYSVSEGYLPLRRWVAERMAQRGIDCGIDNVVITAGSQQGLDLLGKLFLSAGDTALVTAPTYLGALQAFNAYEPRYDSLRLEDGNRTPAAYREAAKSNGGRVALAYVVPEFANPTGETLSLAARRNLLELAGELDIPVVEDAAYEALRFEGEALPSCLALDIARAGSIERSRVIYCGTFSKTIAPGLRVGFICAARHLVHKVVLAKQAADLHSATLNQMAMHQVVEAVYDRQIPKIVESYRRRRDAMLSALARHMPDGVSWTRPQGGMFVFVTLPEGLDGAALLADALAQARIAFVPGEAFFVDGSGANSIRLNYSLQSEAGIEEGIARLGRLIAGKLASPRAA